MDNDSKIRVRYAPSPTGRLHVGGVRTALFNWLFARKNGGTFVLRIEDTDLERSTEESVEQLKGSMRWIGLDWDEGPEAGGPHPPYRQTDRFDLYREAAKRLIDSGAAYYDFATPEELAELRERARAEKRQPIYTGGEYRELDPEEAKKRIDAGDPYTVRFKTPREGQTVAQDMIRGPVTFENANLEDFVLMKSTDTPTYNFAPAFAHVPQVLGPDKKKLSKRHGASSVEDFAEKGYLPEALFNYLALLGAGYAADEEIFTPDELAERFRIDRVSGNPAILDEKKLRAVNAVYMRRKSLEELALIAAPLLVEAGVATQEELDVPRLREIMNLLKERIALTTEIPDSVGYFYGGSLEYDEEEFEKQFSKEFVRENFPELVECLTALPEWTETAIEEAVRGLAAEKEKGARHLIHPLRFAVTGRTVSAGLFETMQLLGRERSLLRAGDAVEKMQRLPV